MGIPNDSNIPTNEPPKRRLKIRLVTTYAGAKARGNTLLYLPRPIRDTIYATALSLPSPTTPHALFHRDIEVPDTGSPTLPSLCSVDATFRREITSLLFRTATFTLPSDAAIYNFRAWLKDLREDGKEGGFALPRSIAFPALSVMQKPTPFFAANSTALLRILPNLRAVSLMLDLRDIEFVIDGDDGGVDGGGGGKRMDIGALVRKYDFEALVEVKGLKTVVVELLPYMALEKEIRRCCAGRGLGWGLGELWGLKGWIEEEVRRRGGCVEVFCPGAEGFGGGW